MGAEAMAEETSKDEVLKEVVYFLKKKKIK